MMDFLNRNKHNANFREMYIPYTTGLLLNSIGQLTVFQLTEVNGQIL